MCGRYFRRSDKQRIAEAFKVGVPSSFEILPDYNVAPATMQPVVVEDRDSGDRSLALMRWGLIPSWCDDPKQLGVSTINAKGESLMKKPIWREPFLRRRCLVPADGFYEWQKLDAKTKQPWAIGLRGSEPFAFAGLWEHWKPRDGQPAFETFSIITTEANELTAPMHNRMPVIVAPRDYERWLRRGDPGRPPVDLLRPHEPASMKAWKVGAAVGNVKNNSAELLEPAIAAAEKAAPPYTPSLFDC
ncbi:MAG TPA: SOS response-associated peptidase [Acidobacteriaceae bacterium]|jgi:putative SOS response-associated peptidase YedK|nr:SOS response-associated peptidase [Acidobacteriaceae bacterium]